jgi:uncharacterized small protein (DUF1192 family)
MNPILKKLIRDYNYLNETLDDVKEISSVAEGEFRNALLASDPEAVEALAPKNQVQVDIEIKEEDTEISEITNNDDPKFKKLFRKIAVKCHPDKLGDINLSETKFLKKAYEDLNDANTNHDWGMLLKLAMELDIEFDELGIDEINNISENISIIKGDIARYENSMAYSWYIKNDEDSKKEYLAICADIFKKSLDKD